jgi:hypothetical protein
LSREIELILRREGFEPISKCFGTNIVKKLEFTNYELLTTFYNNAIQILGQRTLFIKIFYKKLLEIYKTKDVTSKDLKAFF